MKKRIILLVASFLVMGAVSCGSPEMTSSEENYSRVDSGASSGQDDPAEDPSGPASGESTAASTSLEAKGEEEIGEMVMKIGETTVSVIWEENASVEALKAMASGAPLTIQMSMYGGFEQVGPLGSSLPKADVQMTTEAGDIVLYSGNQIVVFYGENSWSYTKLGHISDKNAEELTDLLSNGDVILTIEIG